MRAAVYRGNQQFAIEDLADPVPAPGQVVVDVEFCAICGTDVHAIMYDIAPVGSILGHEYSGTISRVGAGVDRWKIGDRVIGGGGDPPPTLASAKGPRFNYRNEGFPTERIRAYAEKVLMEEWEPIAVPDGVSSAEAAMCEPCAVAVHAVRISKMRLGSTVAVLGAGPIGLLCMQVARAAGASRVLISEPAPARAEAARRLGADAVVDPMESDVIDRIVDLSDGIGPDVVFECAAAKSTLDDALQMVRRDGQVMLVAITWEPTELLPPDWMAREVGVQSSFGTRPEDWRIALDLIRTGKVTMDPLVTDASFLPLENIQGAFEALCQPSTQLQMVVKHG